MEYKQIFSKESRGQYGAFGIQVLVSCDRMPDMHRTAIRYAVYEAADAIESAILECVVAADAEAMEHSCKEREGIVGLFEQPIFVEEIPNGYCPKWCCKHLPWFVVTTKVGRIKLGWRKRVISIDWEDSRATQTADTLFPGENVTKDGRLIHAWSLEKAKQYIDTVIASVMTEPAVID